MAYEKVVPKWNAAGAEPPDSLKNSGFTAGYKPPAAYFNWFWHGISEAVKELQSEAFAYFGNNPISSVDDDTPEKWAALGGGYARYNATGQLNGQPSAYGILLNFGHASTSDVFQMWKCMASGAVYFRSGNNTGWVNNWFALYSNLNKPSADDLNVQPKHYYYEPTDFGCTSASTATEIWNKLPEHSVFVYQASSLTDKSWNLPTQLAIIRIEKFALNRGSIQLFSKVLSNKDYRMYLDDSTGEPTGEWYEYYTSGNKPSPDDIGALPNKPNFIEFATTSSADNGGYIDFHFAGSEADYTSRIIESAEGVLRLIAPNGVKVPSLAPSETGVRNIQAGTTDMTAGTSTLATGHIYLVYV